MDAATGQSWYDEFKAQTLAQAETTDLAEIEKHQPAAYLLLAYLYEEGRLSSAQAAQHFAAQGTTTAKAQLAEIALPAYQYAGKDPIERLVYETLAKEETAQGFPIYAVQVIDHYTEDDQLKVFAIYYVGEYRLSGQEVREESGALLPVALTYQQTAEGVYTLVQRQTAQDGSYFAPSIESYCTLPVSGKTIPGLSKRILSAYQDHEPLLALVREHLTEHLQKYGQTGVSLADPADGSVIPLT